MEIRETKLEVEHEGIVLRGSWFVREDLKAAPVLIILHGIPRTRPIPGDQSYREMAQRFARLGFVALTFNFRGCGLSEGDLSLAGWRRDLKRILDFARELPQAQSSALVLLGFSGGASVAIQVAAESPNISAVISASSPADYSLLQKVMPSAGWVQLFRELGLIRSPEFPPSLAAWEKEFEMLSPLNWVHLLSPRPLFLLHGEEDELVPVDHARRIFEKAGEPKELVLVPGGKHRLRVDPKALDLIEQWLIKWKDKI